ncbi:hypothetical protein BDV39DRAFT_168550 [Aspergillus sergii]|uniref:Uncharacterized protein n=1 Tax=Aspergillus sergii TaxID=1034303 RepID=A0A5N6XJQ8_9EURO|nr:hypothetical protein BDV39DRAFT_168550 [Aspergillus sergii]
MGYLDDCEGNGDLLPPLRSRFECPPRVFRLEHHHPLFSLRETVLLVYAYTLWITMTILNLLLLIQANAVYLTSFA